MKKKIILPFAAGLALLSSCNYLDVVPDGTPTLDDIFSSSLQTERFLFNLYNYMPNTGSYFTPEFFAGGDMISGTNGQTRWYQYKSILYDEENANNTYFGFWDATSSSPTGRSNYDLYKGIRYAYTLIENIDRVPNMSQAERNTFTGEAYFLIAYYHWLLMEHYGPVVIVRNEISINAPEDETMLPRSPWDECARFVTETFDKAAGLLPPTRPDNELGRATSVAAKAYKSRVLMYTASPFVNGNEVFSSFMNYDGTPMMSDTYDKEKWKTAMDAVQEAITFAEQNGHKLYEDPASVNLPDAQRGRNNYYNCFLHPWNRDEYLFAVAEQAYATRFQQLGAPRQWNPEEGDAYTTDGFRNYFTPTLQLVETFLTDNGLPLWADPETKDDFAANRLLTYTGEPDNEVARLHQNRDPRFYATVGYDRGEYEYNGGTVTLRMRQGEHHGYTGNPTHEYNSCTGYVLQKYVSRTTTYNETTRSITYAEYPYPYIRLAELYLDYAEADFEYDGELSAQGLEYLNRVRHRAGLPDFQASWNRIGGMPAGETMRKALHYENLAEMCCEGRWYHNLRRWNVAQDWLSETPDVLNIEGQTAAQFYTIAKMRENGVRSFTYPKTYWLAIPMSEIEINFRLVQNPGY